MIKPTLFGNNYPQNQPSDKFTLICNVFLTKRKKI